MLQFEQSLPIHRLGQRDPKSYTWTLWIIPIHFKSNIGLSSFCVFSCVSLKYA